MAEADLIHLVGSGATGDGSVAIKTSIEDSTTVVNMGAAKWAAWQHRPQYLDLTHPFTLPLAVGGYDVPGSKSQ